MSGHLSSEEVYQALSQTPLDVEVAFKVQSPTGPAVSVKRLIKGLSLQGSEVIAFPSASTATDASSEMLVKSSWTTVSPTSCIRTLELSLKKQVSASPRLTLESFRASLDLNFQGKSVFANGYESWSTSYNGADHTTSFEKPNWLYNELTHLPLASDMHIYEYPGVKGMVHSNVVTTIRDLCQDVTVPIPGDNKHESLPEELVLCGSLSEDTGYSYFLMDMNRNRFTIMQDCAGKKLVSPSDTVVLKTYFTWGTTDAVVWDGYTAAWTSIHTDRRFIKSTTEKQVAGYTSWYLHYATITENIILENLNYFSSSGTATPSQGWPGKVFQIDDGYTTVGDWLSPDTKKFPRGMTVIAQAIRDKGLTPGLWLAPFLACRKSKIVQERPNWFVRKPEYYQDSHDLDEKVQDKMSGLGCCLGFESGSNEPMLSHSAFPGGSVALDLENPEVQAHLANVFRVVTKEWGFSMLKLDFLFAAAQVPRNGKTRGQLMWEALQMVRTWVGPEVILLGCGVPLGASFMLMDYCRIGCDVGGDWDSMQRYFHDREYISTYRSLTSTLSRWAMSGRFFGNDPDVFFVRDWKLGLNQTQRWSLMLLNHLLGHLVFCSDPLDINRLSHEQKAALDQFFPWCSTPDVATPPHQVARVLQPILTEKDLYFVQVHAQGRTYIVASNLSSKRQTVHLSTMDRIISREAGETQPQRHTSVYFQASTNQFGLATAAYSLKSYETCVFLRVVDSQGRLCSTTKDGGKASGDNALSGELHLMATKGGHVLPTTEVEAFGRHFGSDDETQEYQAKFRPSHFGKQVQVWLAWHESKKDNGMKKGVVEGKSLNGKTLQAHPEIVLGHSICVASCSFSI
ncbi:hypothetical protein BGZ74_007650 [Mortierella antarctica]|nr:hypothetical protein BGZ74_007650 [Mortierella antarctica]